jgi:hypothetical protein
MDSNDTKQDNTKVSKSPTPFQYGMGLLLLGTSAGLTLYTKKTQSILNQMNQMKRNREMRFPKKMEGPLSKEEWERTRSRWEKDDL